MDPWAFVRGSGAVTAERSHHHARHSSSASRPAELSPTGLGRGFAEQLSPRRSMMASLQTELFPGVRTGCVPAPTTTVDSDALNVNAGAGVGVGGVPNAEGHRRRRSSWSELGFK